MKKKLKILFMGTPDFAVNSLDSIYRSKHDLCCVVTSPDKKSGRGQKLRTSPIKDYCIKNKINNVYLYPFVFQKFLKRFQKLRFNTIYILFPDPWPKKKAQ